MQDNAAWFKKLARAVKTLVTKHGGAILVERDTLRSECLLINNGLNDCPEKVWEHVLSTIRPNAGLRSFGVAGDNHVVIFDPVALKTKDHEAVRQHVKVLGELTMAS